MTQLYKRYKTYYENWVEAIFAAMLNAKIICCTACISLVI
jgi:hypothetical protein